MIEDKIDKLLSTTPETDSYKQQLIAQKEKSIIEKCSDVNLFAKVAKLIKGIDKKKLAPELQEKFMCVKALIDECKM